MDPLEDYDPRRIDGFALEGRLGAGGMGQVYLGIGPDGRRVAVKVIHDALARDPRFRARFGHEVAAARRVQGRHTAPLVAADPQAARPWMATAYIDADNLLEIVDRDGPLSTAQLRRLAVGAAHGLQAIHAAGIVHRDLKPSNVLMAPDGPRIIDFGVARAAEATSLTGTGQVTGSAGYMSPEQAEGGRVGPAGDVFSLGALLFFAATGRSAFGTGPAAALLFRVVHGSPDLTGLDDGEFLDLVARCLRKDPDDRPSLDEVVALAQGRSRPIDGTDDAPTTDGRGTDGRGPAPDTVVYAPSPPDPGLRHVDDRGEQPTVLRSGAPVGAYGGAVMVGGPGAGGAGAGGAVVGGAVVGGAAAGGRARRRGLLVGAAAAAALVIVVSVAALASTGRLWAARTSARSVRTTATSTAPVTAAAASAGGPTTAAGPRAPSTGTAGTGRTGIVLAAQGGGTPAVAPAGGAGGSTTVGSAAGGGSTASGRASSSAQASTPGAVGSAALSDPTGTTLVLSWTAATDATGYRLAWVESGTGRTWTSASPNYTLGDSPVTLTGLSPGHTYSVQITPYDATGDGPTTTSTASTLP